MHFYRFFANNTQGIVRAPPSTRRIVDFGNVVTRNSKITFGVFFCQLQETKLKLFSAIIYYGLTFNNNFNSFTLEG